MRVRGAALSPPESASNPQPVLHHAAGVVSTAASIQSWLTVERLFDGDSNALAEELEPLWFTTLLLRVPEVRSFDVISESALGQDVRPSARGRVRVRSEMEACVDLRGLRANPLAIHLRWWSLAAHPDHADTSVQGHVRDRRKHKRAHPIVGFGLIWSTGDQRT